MAPYRKGRILMWIKLPLTLKGHFMFKLAISYTSFDNGNLKFKQNEHIQGPPKNFFFFD